MRHIVNSTYVTLDGVIQNPQDWPSLGSFSDDGSRIQADLLDRCDAVLMGRHTYDGFAPVWPSRSGDPVSDRMNAPPKYVVSTTPKDPEWHNTTIIDHDPIEAVRDLKDQPGAGSASDLLYQAGSSGRFELADSTSLDSGIVILTCRASRR